MESLFLPQISPSTLLSFPPIRLAGVGLAGGAVAVNLGEVDEFMGPFSDAVCSLNGFVERLRFIF